MMYNPKSKSIEIPQNALDMVYHELLYAIRNIRQLAGLPLDKYKKEPGEGFTPADLAQISILNAAKAIGIDMGAQRGEQLDVREEK